MKYRHDQHGNPIYDHWLDRVEVALWLIAWVPRWIATGFQASYLPTNDRNWSEAVWMLRMRLRMVWGCWRGHDIFVTMFGGERPLPDRVKPQ